MLIKLHEVKFLRSFKPSQVNPNILPAYCSLSDGNPDAFGEVGYARWTMLDGTFECRLMMAKASLSPLTHKGETVKNKLGAATLAARQKEFVQKNSGIVFGEFFHFLDSIIVQDMLAKDSYGFNMFVGLRVAEIQQKTKFED